MAFDRMAFIKKFSIEAREHLQNIEKGLMDLEEDPNNNEILHEIFRSAHTLKGSARMLKLLDINKIAHKMEDLFGLIKEHKLTLTQDITNLLLENCDGIDECLSAAIEQREPDIDVESHVKRLEKAFKQEPFQETPPISKAQIQKPVKKPKPPTETKKTTVQGLKKNIFEHEPKIVLQTRKKPVDRKNIAQTEIKKNGITQKEKIIQEKTSIPPTIPPAAKKPLEETIETHKEVTETKQTRIHTKKLIGDTIRIPVSRLDKLIKFIGEIVLDRSKLGERLKDMNFLFSQLKNLNENINSLIPNEILNEQQIEDKKTINSILKESTTVSGKLYTNYKEDFYQSHTFIEQIKDEILHLRMVPISTLFDTYPRYVRTLANEFGKKIKLNILGANTELDKKMIEDLNDPLVHLIRNSIDHGIEETGTRIEKGKPENGNISLTAKQGRGTIIIEVEDDGNGIDIQRIKETAVRKKLTSKEEINEYSNERLLEFLFMPGFSTTKIITDISGRGVGLDVVRKNVEEKLKGTVSIYSGRSYGTRFTIVLPLTLTTLQALIVKLGDRKFAIPYSYVEETHFRSSKDIIKVVDRTAINIRDKILPLVFLGKVLQLNEFQEKFDSDMTTIILRAGQDRMVFVVDEIIDEQEIVVKPLGGIIDKIPNFSGVTILGDGELVIILHVPDLIHSARVLSESLPSHLRKMKKIIQKQRILVVDDSLNTREVEKNILEAHDYEVEVARDGEEAFEIAKIEKFDLVVTDIEMPRVNGFELTKRLRDHEKYKHTPIIIVTSRDKIEDKKKGMEIGADAYIVKSAFDESNLVDTIETLIGTIKN